MSTDEMVEITSKAETINTKDNIKWTCSSSFRTKDVKMAIDHPVRIQGKKKSTKNTVIESEDSEEVSD